MFASHNRATCSSSAVTLAGRFDDSVRAEGVAAAVAMLVKARFLVGSDVAATAGKFASGTLTVEALPANPDGRTVDFSAAELTTAVVRAAGTLKAPPPDAATLNEGTAGGEGVRATAFGGTSLERTAGDALTNGRAGDLSVPPETPRQYNSTNAKDVPIVNVAATRARRRTRLSEFILEISESLTD